MTRDERRAAMPLSTAFIDSMREHFSLVGIKAQENGHTVEWGHITQGTAHPFVSEYRKQKA